MGREMRLTVFGTSRCICYSHYKINFILFLLKKRDRGRAHPAAAVDTLLAAT